MLILQSYAFDVDFGDHECEPKSPHCFSSVKSCPLLILSSGCAIQSGILPPLLGGSFADVQTRAGGSASGFIALATIERLCLGRRKAEECVVVGEPTPLRTRAARVKAPLQIISNSGCPHHGSGTDELSLRMVSYGFGIS